MAKAIGRARPDASNSNCKLRTGARRNFGLSHAIPPTSSSILPSPSLPETFLVNPIFAESPSAHPLLLDTCRTSHYAGCLSTLRPASVRTAWVPGQFVSTSKHWTDIETDAMKTVVTSAIELRASSEEASR
jgi:hypothetical protein